MEGDERGCQEAHHRADCGRPVLRARYPGKQDADARGNATAEQTADDAARSETARTRGVAKNRSQRSPEAGDDAGCDEE